MKNIVITGSTRGIGQAMAKEFLRAGCNVTISGRGDGISTELEAKLKDFSKNYHYIKCNVQDKSDIETLWEKSVLKWESIDIWINNAGQNSPYDYSYEIAEGYVDAIIDTNIKGVIFGSQVAAKQMLKQGKGQIWNMEGLGSNDMIQVKTILYGTTKRALTYFTQGLAKELKSTPVQAGRLSPGMMLTDFITKTPEGTESPVMKHKNFRTIFNILGDQPKTVARFFIPRILHTTKNDAHIAWLTKTKMMKRFMLSPLSKRKLI